MKIDRLIGITLYLLNRDKATARELAEAFEVSTKTIARDIVALGMAGIPVTSTAGAQGGYHIVEQFRLEKQFCTEAEYAQIYTALGALYSAYRTPTCAGTLEKLRPAVRPDRQHIFLDWSVCREGEWIPAYTALLDKAVARRKAVFFTYTDAEGHTSSRLVEPLALTYKWYAWYLFGYCTLKQDYRSFKLSRMRDLAETEQGFVKEHAGLETLMREQERKDSRKLCTVLLLCSAEIRPAVCEYCNGHVVQELENGGCLYTFTVPENERMWFSLLLGFGDQAEVLSPPELRDRLRRQAKNLLAVYESGQPAVPNAAL